MTAPAFESHDHDRCTGDAMAALRSHCAAKGLQLTPVRERVMELLLDQHRAMGAYDLLALLREEGLGSQPPAIYRALEFLMREGFVHKIERLNAFVACSHAGEAHAPAFLICRSCDAVSESAQNPDNTALSGPATEAGFVIEQTVTEAEGLCPNCQDTEN